MFSYRHEHKQNSVVTEERASQERLERFSNGQTMPVADKRL